MKRVCASNPVLAQKLLRYDPEIGRDVRSPLGRIHQYGTRCAAPRSVCAHRHFVAQAGMAIGRG